MAQQIGWPQLGSCVSAASCSSAWGSDLGFGWLSWWGYLGYVSLTTQHTRLCLFTWCQQGFKRMTKSTQDLLRPSLVSVGQSKSHASPDSLWGKQTPALARRNCRDIDGDSNGKMEDHGHFCSLSCLLSSSHSFSHLKFKLNTVWVHIPPTT